MRVLVYIGAALWISVGIVIFLRVQIFWAQMTNNLVPKPGDQGLNRLFFRASWPDPAEYTELGQRYRKKAIRAQLVMLAYLPTLFIVIWIAMSQ